MQATLLTAPGVATYDLTTAAMKGDWGEVAEGIGGFAGGMAIGAGMSRYGGYGLAFDYIEAIGPMSSQMGGIRLRLGTNTREISQVNLLRESGPDQWVSPEGLEYGSDLQYGDRVQHVRRHVQDQPSRIGEYGVFDSGPHGFIQVVDKAWIAAKQGGSNVVNITVGNKTLIQSTWGAVSDGWEDKEVQL